MSKSNRVVRLGAVMLLQQDVRNFELLPYKGTVRATTFQPHKPYRQLPGTDRVVRVWEYCPPGQHEYRRCTREEIVRFEKLLGEWQTIGFIIHRTLGEVCCNDSDISETRALSTDDVARFPKHAKFLLESARQEGLSSNAFDFIAKHCVCAIRALDDGLGKTQSLSTFIGLIHTNMCADGEARQQIFADRQRSRFNWSEEALQFLESFQF